MDKYMEVDLNIEGVKEVFGLISLDHLPAAQQLAQQKLNRQLLILGFVIVGGVCIYAGYKLAESRFRSTDDDDDDDEESQKTVPDKVVAPKSTSQVINKNNLLSSYSLKMEREMMRRENDRLKELENRT